MKTFASSVLRLFVVVGGVGAGVDLVAVAVAVNVFVVVDVGVGVVVAVVVGSACYCSLFRCSSLIAVLYSGVAPVENPASRPCGLLQDLSGIARTIVFIGEASC